MARFQPLSRRKFLAQTSALTVASSLSIESFAQEAMRSRAIPGTSEYLPVIGMGAPGMFYQMPAEGPELPKSIIRTMVDMGGRVMDTPAFFRPDVPVIGNFINEMGLQDDLFLTGKITVNGKQEGIDHLEKIVANLNKDPMDLLVVQNFRDTKNNWPTLKDWKDEGRVRYIGVSRTNDADEGTLEQFMNDERPDFIMPGYYERGNRNK